MAARGGNLDEVRRLVDKGADISIKDNKGVSKQTALCFLEAQEQV